MKNTRTLALLLLVAAAGNSAQAQVRQLQAGAAYTISNVSAATGSGVSYQWYRNGQPISGATTASYTIPAGEAYGENVEFKRGVKSLGCPGDVMFSNAVFFSFYNLVINGLRWADANVAQPKQFAAKPDMYTQFYQWNRPNKAWAATGNVTGWTETSITDPTWVSTPCPEGWRLPMQAEIKALDNSGSTGIDNSTRGNSVPGRFFGVNNATCTLPNNMAGCVFLPRGGARDCTAGGLANQGVNGYYWSSTTTNGGASVYVYLFGATATNPDFTNNDKASGFSIRCVR